MTRGKILIFEPEPSVFTGAARRYCALLASAPWTAHGETRSIGCGGRNSHSHSRRQPRFAGIDRSSRRENHSRWAAASESVGIIDDRARRLRAKPAELCAGSAIIGARLWRPLEFRRARRTAVFRRHSRHHAGWPGAIFTIRPEQRRPHRSVAGAFFRVVRQLVGRCDLRYLPRMPSRVIWPASAAEYGTFNTQRYAVKTTGDNGLVNYVDRRFSLPNRWVSGAFRRGAQSLQCEGRTEPERFLETDDCRQRRANAVCARPLGAHARASLPRIRPRRG